MKRIVAFFDDETQVEAAIERLEAAGANKDSISVVTARDIKESAPERTHEGMTTGGVIGAATGLIMGLGAFAVPGVGLLAAAGPVASFLAGAAAGGLLGSLADLGFSASSSEDYVREIERGSIFLSLDTGEPEKTEKILQEAGAYRTERA